MSSKKIPQSNRADLRPLPVGMDDEGSGSGSRFAAPAVCTAAISIKRARAMRIRRPRSTARSRLIPVTPSGEIVGVIRQSGRGAEARCSNRHPAWRRPLENRKDPLQQGSGLGGDHVDTHLGAHARRSEV